MSETKSVGPMWPHWENQLAKARREGVIEGLEWAVTVKALDWKAELLAEIERLRREG